MTGNKRTVRLIADEPLNISGDLTLPSGTYRATRVDSDIPEYTLELSAEQIRAFGLDPGEDYQWEEDVTKFIGAGLREA